MAQEKSYYCPSCGKSNAHIAKFCANCGNQLVWPETRNTTELETQAMGLDQTQEIPGYDNVCQLCQQPAKTQYLSLDQNTGMLFMRRTTTFRGYMCPPCGKKTFIRVQLHGLFLGWWGTISFFVNSLNLLVNTYSYIHFVRTKGK